MHPHMEKPWDVSRVCVQKIKIAAILSFYSPTDAPAKILSHFSICAAEICMHASVCSLSAECSEDTQTIVGISQNYDHTFHYNIRYLFEYSSLS